MQTRADQPSMNDSRHLHSPVPATVTPESCCRPCDRIVKNMLEELLCLNTSIPKVLSNPHGTQSSKSPCYLKRHADLPGKWPARWKAPQRRQLRIPPIERIFFSLIWTVHRQECQRAANQHSVYTTIDAPYLGALSPPLPVFQCQSRRS